MWDCHTKKFKLSVKTDNLNFSTDLQDQVMIAWSVIQQMIVYKGRLLKKIFNSKIKASPVNAVHYITFKLHISFATYLAADFGCNWFRIIPDIISKLLSASIWSYCAGWSRTPKPFLGHVIDLDLMLNTGKWCCVPMSYFYSETKDWLKDRVKQWVLLW